MCNLPGCPSNRDDMPPEVTDENRPAMRVEASSAAIKILEVFSRGWTGGAQGILSDIGDSWGFEGISRVMYCVCLSSALLPMPENGIQRATAASIRENLARVAGEEVADQMAHHMITVGDQVFAAHEELRTLAATGTEDAWHARFDKITDQENMFQPLVSTVMVHGAVVFREAHRTKNAAALDQLQAAVRNGIDLGRHDQKAQDEIAALQACFAMDDAPDGD